MRKKNITKKLRLLEAATEVASATYRFASLPDYLKGKSGIHAHRITGPELADAGVPEGAYCVVDAALTPTPGSLALILDSEGTCSVRYVYFAPGGYVRCQSANREEYPDLIYKPDGALSIRPVVHIEYAGRPIQAVRRLLA